MLMERSWLIVLVLANTQRNPAEEGNGNVQFLVSSNEKVAIVATFWWPASSNPDGSLDQWKKIKQGSGAATSSGNSLVRVLVWCFLVFPVLSFLFLNRNLEMRK